MPEFTSVYYNISQGDDAPRRPWKRRGGVAIRRIARAGGDDGDDTAPSQRVEEGRDGASGDGVTHYCLPLGARTQIGVAQCDLFRGNPDALPGAAYLGDDSGEPKRISHAELMSLARRIVDRRVPHLIEMWSERSVEIRFDGTAARAAGNV